MVFQEKWYPWFQRKKKRKQYFVKCPEAQAFLEWWGFCQGAWTEWGAGGSFKTSPQIPAAPA